MFSHTAAEDVGAVMLPRLLLLLLQTLLRLLLLVATSAMVADVVAFVLRCRWCWGCGMRRLL